jgi:hypothetical protein
MVTRDLRKNKPELIKDPIDVRLTKAHPALLPIIDHHKARLNGGEWECDGCDWGNPADTAPEWPCSTINLILEGLSDDG